MSLESYRRSLLCGLLLFVLGCGDEEIRAYQAPKDPPGRPLAELAGSSSPAATSARIQWTLPQGWKQLPGSGMRFATLLVPCAGEDIELRVTPLGPAARDPLANVNRWRGQIGLSPIDEAQLQEILRTTETRSGQAQWVQLEGARPEDDGILAAMLDGHEEVWFFVLFARTEQLSSCASGFEGFLGSVELTGAPGPTASRGGEMQTAAPVEQLSEEMTWELPPGWTQETNSSSMRVATFTATGSRGSALVVITRFPGDVGGDLANINRWRGQLDLAAVERVADQPLRQTRVAGQKAHWIDLISPKAAPGSGESERMLAAWFMRRGATWFIKMTGSESAIEEQLTLFETFLQSIQLQERS